MKKVILSLALVAGLSFNASAAVGILTGSSFIAYTGLVKMAVGAGYSVKAIFTKDPVDWIKAGKIGFVGLILLDDEGLSEFGPVHGQLEGVTSQEIAIYNSEVEEANIIAEEVVSQIDRDTSVSESQELWRSYEENLSPETLKVMGVIVGE